MTKNEPRFGALPAHAREALLHKALGAGLERSSPSEPPVQARSSRAMAPLSFGQQRMWFLAQLDKSGAAYHLDDAVRLDGELDIAAFRAALDALIARHGALRTRFVLVDGKPMQTVEDEAIGGFPLSEEDLCGHPDAEAAVETAIRRFSNVRFDLYRGPLARALLLHIAPRTHVFLMTLHHIVCDGWSIGILVRELAAIYAALASGERVPSLPAHTLEYVAYADWQRRTVQGAVLEEQLAYWARMLSDAPRSLPLPTNRPRSDKRAEPSASRAVFFDATLAQRLHARCMRRGATLYMAALAAWALALSRLSGERDMVIATPVANRTRVEFESIVGLFANTVPLRIDLRALGDMPTIDAVLMLVRARVLEAQRNQDAPFERIVQSVRPDRHTAHAPLLQLMFAWQEQPLESVRVSQGLSISPYKAVHRTRDSELVISLSGTGAGIVGHITYSTALYDASTIDAFIGAWQGVLGAMADNPSMAARMAPLMSEASREQLLLDWNPSARPSIDDAVPLVHERVAMHAHATPDAIAIVQDGMTVRYGELERRAARLSHRLRTAGVRPDTLVALMAGKSAAAIVGMLAILKAGGAYLPLELMWPRSALADALARGKPVVVLADERGREALAALIGRQGAPFEIPLVDLATDEDVAPSDVVPAVHAHNLAYAICTSGSTGRPKIVLVEHRNVASLLRWQREAYPLAPGAHVSSVASLGFDAAVLEIWTALCAGAVLHLPPLSENGLTLDELLAWWLRQPLEASFLPTPVAEYAFARRLTHPTLRRLFVGGDRLRSLPRAMSATLTDLYGPSEATVLSIEGAVDLHRTHPSLGRPASHATIYVLDSSGEPLPIGVPGEIHIGGACVSRGYLDDPVRTAARFLPDSFSQVPGARLYATGDIGRWLPDGTIAFIGRNVHQVKVSGVRVDLSAIEANIVEHPAVRDAVVVARRLADEDDAMLMAYVVPVREASAPNAAELRDYLAERLPPYLIPAAFVPLDGWRLDANGKLDRAALPAPSIEHRPPIGTEPPVGEYEMAVARIWCELLRLPTVCRDDDFFALGGYSLLCAVMNHRLYAAFGVDVGIRRLYECRTLRAVAERVAALCGGHPESAVEVGVAGQASDGEPSAADASAVLRAQRRIWLASQSDTGHAAYHVGFRLTIDGELSIARLQEAVDTTMRRHPSLRATFAETSTGLVRIVGEGVHGVVIDRTSAATDRAENERLANAPYDLARGPLVRIVACREGTHHVVYAVLHHLLTDGVGAQRFIQEVFTGYVHGGAAGPSHPMAAADDDHARHAARERRYLAGAAYEADLNYWRDRLAGYDARPVLPPDFPDAQGLSRAVGLSGSKCGIDRAALHAKSRALGCTPHQLLLACAFIALHRLSRRDDLAICIPVHLRDRAEQFEAMGLFINMLPIRLRLDDFSSIARCADAVRQAFDEAYPHKRAPFEDVARPAEQGGQPGALMSTMFVHSETASGTPGVDDPRISMQALPTPGAKCDFNLFAAEDDQCVRLSIEFDADRFSWLTAEALLDHFEAAARAALAGEGEIRGYRMPDAVRMQRWRDTVATLLKTAPDRPLAQRDVAWARLEVPAPVTVLRDAVARTLGVLLGDRMPAKAISFEEVTPSEAGREAEQRAFGAQLLALRSRTALHGVLSVREGWVHTFGVVVDPRCCFGRFAADAIVRDIAATHAGQVLQPVYAPSPWRDVSRACSRTRAQRNASSPQPKLERPDAGDDAGWRIGEAQAGDARLSTILAALAVTLCHYTGQSDFDLRLVDCNVTQACHARSLLISCDPTRSTHALREDVERALERVALDAIAPADAALDDGQGLRVQVTRGGTGLAPGATISRMCVSSDRGIYVHLREDALVNFALDARYFDAGFAARLAASFERVLARLHEVNAPARVVDACASAEPAAPMPAPCATLVSGFIEQARRNPGGEALQCGKLRVDYGSVLRDARAAAIALGDRGVRRGSLVAVLLDDPLEYARAVVSVALAGAAYLPLDPQWPTLRREAVLAHALPDLLITDIGRPAGGAGAGPAVLTWPMHGPSPIDALPQDAPARREPCSPDDLAYVIYTSGSTGTPKGVAMTHGAAANTIGDVNRRIGLSARDAIYAISSFAFDLSVYDLFGALAVGAKVVFPQAGDRLSPSAWLRDLREGGVTVWNSVPALAELLVDRAQHGPMSSLRCVLLSGDRIPVALPDRLRHAFSPDHILSLGGATEAGIWSIAYPIQDTTRAWRAIPYGEPLAGQHFLVFDAAGEPCPSGVPGELHIGGAGLALGYWRDPEQTARAFFRHRANGSRLYRTGDLGYRRFDGLFEILGRLDERIKLRGYRIETGEIEAALRAHADVADARVWIEGEGTHTHIVAAVCASDEATTAALPAWIAARLPAPMHPTRYIRVARWPLTPNGKVDAAALRQAAASGPTATARPPTTSREASLLALWRTLLALDESQPLGVHDDFFDVGGHSLLAVQMLECLNEQGSTVPYRTFLAHTTIARLAAYLDSSEPPAAGAAT